MASIPGFEEEALAPVVRHHHLVEEAEEDHPDNRCLDVEDLRETPLLVDSMARQISTGQTGVDPQVLLAVGLQVSWVQEDLVVLMDPQEDPMDLRLDHQV